MSINGCMDKQIVVHANNRILFNHKKEWSTKTYSNVDKTKKYYAKWKNLGKNFIYGMIPFIWNI